MELFKPELSAKAEKLIYENTDLINSKLEEWIKNEKDKPKEPSKARVRAVSVDALNILKTEKKRSGIDARSLGSTDVRERAISKLLKRGVGMPQIIGVIKYKVKEWVGTEFEQHLNPETLFGEKFQKYLEAARDAAIKDLPKKKSNEPNVYDSIMSNEKV